MDSEQGSYIFNKSGHPSLLAMAEDRMDTGGASPVLDGMAWQESAPPTVSANGAFPPVSGHSLPAVIRGDEDDAMGGPTPAASSPSSGTSAFRRFAAPEQPAPVAGTSGRVASGDHLPPNPARNRGPGIVRSATTSLVDMYRRCNPSQFAYSHGANPKRSLTKPTNGTKNDGHDNENSDLILYVNDVLINHQPSSGICRRYVIQEMLGQGTFGQVRKI